MALDDESALAFADRRDQIHDPHAQVAVFRLETEAAFRIARSQIVEGDARLGDFRLVAVDRLDLEQREVALPLLRRADLTTHRVARLQVEALDLRRRDVDVVRAVEVVPILAAQKAVALGQNLEHSLAGEEHILIEQLLLDLEDELLLAKRADVLHVIAFGYVLELENRFALQLSDIHGRRDVGRDKRLSGDRRG
jgi:hypothetical protein